MHGPSRMSKPQTSKGIPNATSSQASGAGPSPSPSQGGLQMSLFGQARPPASHSATLEGTLERPTKDTSGLSSSVSLRSAALQLSLENRLQARLEGRGSPEYALTWKGWPMESGLPICALRASGHRISGNDSTGWPTPSASQFEQNPEAWEARRQRNLAKGYNGNGQGATLDIAAHRAGWPTPTATERSGVNPNTGQGAGLSLTAHRAGWTTPQAMEPDANYRPSREATGRTTDYLGRQVHLIPGQTPSPSPALTGKRVVLNVAFVCWLMGFPAGWDDYAG